MKPLHHFSSGVALLEALVALGVLVFALLGLLVLQMRSGTDGHLAVQRQLATRLAQDLFERIKANPGGTAVFRLYLSAADPAETVSVSGQGTLQDCQTQPCAPLALAAWDLEQWRQQLGRDLPQGRAVVLAPESGAGQLGVLLSWRAQEAARDADYLGPLRVEVPPGQPALRCPDGHICQLLFSTP